MHAPFDMPATFSYAIRQLDTHDVDLVYELLAVFADVFDEPDTYWSHRPGKDYLERQLDSGDCLFVVALLGTQVVGGLTAYELKKFEQERSELFIYDLAVHEEHRRRGLATALIEEVKSIGRDRGAHLVFVQSESDDVPSSTAYSQFADPLKVHHYEFSPRSRRRDA